jgi:hypothetical protein
MQTVLLLISALAAAGQMQDIPSPPDLGSVIQKLASQFAAVATQVLGTLNSTVIDLSRVAYVSTLFLGSLLYTTRLEKRLGKDLIKGGVILAFLSEVVFPLINKM